MASVQKISLIPSTSATATITGDSSTLDAGNKNFIGFIKVSSRVSGTFTGKIQHSPNNGVDWSDLASFAAISSNTHEVLQITGNVLGTVRGIITGASTPNATVELDLLFENK